MKAGDISTYILSMRTWRSDKNERIYLQRKELRATAKYLIDDKTGTKYKKYEAPEDNGAVASHTVPDKWHSSTTIVYLVESKFVQDAIKHNKRVNFLGQVQQVLADLKPATVEEAIEVVKMHNLGELVGDIPE